MSILMPNGRHWLVSNWISRGFFEDCLPYLDHAPHLQEDVEFCINAEVDTLDIRNKDMSVLEELKTLVSFVIERNIHFQGSNFSSPENFPIYLDKLKKLQNIIHT